MISTFVLLMLCFYDVPHTDSTIARILTIPTARIRSAAHCPNPLSCSRPRHGLCSMALRRGSAPHAMSASASGSPPSVAASFFFFFFGVVMPAPEPLRLRTVRSPH